MFHEKMAGVTGLEPAASGVTGRFLGVIWNKMVPLMLNTYHGLPPIPTQKLEQVGTVSVQDFKPISLYFFSDLNFSINELSCFAKIG